MLIGIALALSATLAYTFNSLFLSLLKEKGGHVSTKYMLFIALIVNLCIHFLVYKQWYPVYLDGRQFLFLGLSGIIGLSLGFIIMIKAMQLIGPRLVLLIVTTTTVFSFLLGWLFLGETQPFIGFVYIAMIIGGIIIAILSRDRSLAVDDTPQYGAPGIAAAPGSSLLRGVLLTLLLAFCQGLSQLLSKTVLLEDVPALGVNIVRLSVAAGGLLILTPFLKKAGRISVKNFGKREWLLIALIALAGPVISGFLNLSALRYLNLGISASIFQLSPVFMLFLSRIVFKEKIKLYAVLGTLLAVSGTVLLALS